MGFRFHYGLHALRSDLLSTSPSQGRSCRCITAKRPNWLCVVFHLTGCWVSSSHRRRGGLEPIYDPAEPFLERTSAEIDE